MSFTNKRSRRYSVLLLVIAGSVLAYGLVRFWDSLQELQWQHFWVVYANADPLGLAVAFLLALASFYWRAARWKLMCLRLNGRGVQTWAIFKATSIGFTSVILMGRAGELVRPYLIALKSNLSFSSQLGIWLVERFYDLLAILCLAGFALIILEHSTARAGNPLVPLFQRAGYALALITVVALAFLLVAVYRVEVLQARLSELIQVLPASWRPRFEQTLDSFLRGLKSLRDPQILWGALFYTVIEWGLILTSNIFLFRAIPQTKTFSITDVVFLVGFVALGSSIQLPAVGGGVQVVGFLLLNNFYGMRAETALGIALFLWVLNFTVILPLGLWFAFHEGLSLRKLKQESRREVVLE